MTSTDHHASEGVVHTLEKVLNYCFSWQYVDDVYFDKYDTESKSDLNDDLDQVMQLGSWVKWWSWSQVMQPATASILDTLQSDRFSCNHDNPQSSCFFLIFLQPKTFPMHWNCHSINLWPDNLKQPLSQYNEIFFLLSQFNFFLAALEAHGLAEELSKPGLTNLTSLIGRRTAKILKRGKMNLLMVALLIHSISKRTMNIYDSNFQTSRKQWQNGHVIETSISKTIIMAMTKGAITVFAPTDEAMARLDEETRAKVREMPLLFCPVVSQ